MIDADQYAAHLVMLGLADSTVRAYRSLFQRWLDWAITDGGDGVPDPVGVRAWSRTIHGSRAMLGQASAMIGHLCRVLDVDDCSGAIPLPRHPSTPSRALDRDKAAALETAAHQAGIAGTAVLVGLYTAARRGEIAGMEWENVTITVDTDEPTYGGFIRWWRPKVRDWHEIPLHPVLAEHLVQRRSGRWLFPGRYGGHVSPAQIWKWVGEVAEQAGVGKVTPHVLRHTSITTVNDISGDLRAAQLIAGHTDPSITARYSRVDAERLARVVSMVDYSRSAVAADAAG